MSGHYILLELTDQEGLKTDYIEKKSKNVKSNTCLSRTHCCIGYWTRVLGMGNPSSFLIREIQRGGELHGRAPHREVSWGLPSLHSTRDSEVPFFRVLMFEAWEIARGPHGHCLFFTGPGITFRDHLAAPYPLRKAGKKNGSLVPQACRLPQCGLRDPLTSALLFVPKP